MDRIDIQVDVPPVEYRELTGSSEERESERMKEEVEKARRRQVSRFDGNGILCNATMQARHVQAHCQPDQDGRTLLRQAVDALGLSARAYNKVLKVARTIADLEGSEDLRPHHLSEAINYRSLDREVS